MTRHVTALAVLLMLGASVPAASAQTAAPNPASTRAPALSRAYISINGLYQGTNNGFADHWSVQYYFEPESLNATYDVKPAAVIDVGGGVRLWRNLAAGAAFSRYHQSAPASMTATVPNPLLFNQPRDFSGAISGPDRTETAIHAHAMWVAAAGSRVRIGVFGGPSFYSIRQVIVSGITFAEAYPYTTLTVASTTTKARTTSKVGYNLGTDLTVLVTRNVGVGMLFRYTGVSAGSVPPPVAGTGPSGLYQSSRQAGGLQVGGGLRLLF